MILYEDHWYIQYWVSYLSITTLTLSTSLFDTSSSMYIP